MRTPGHNKIAPRRRGLRPAFDRLDDRTLLSGLTPAEVAAAYGLDGLTFSAPNGSSVPGNGAGETIALIEAYHDPTLASDLQTFDQAYGLPNPALSVVDLAGPQVDYGWALEESLDVEWAHAIAPAANILVVEASSQSLKPLIAAVNVARNTPGIVAVSMSWGFSEFAHETAYNSTFTTPAGHTGITFLAASGDSGPQGGSEWPASAPNVVAVGGTTLVAGSSGQYEVEFPWSGSSGGYSKFEPEPNYQRSVQDTGKRSSPDVSFDGDPNTGVNVYETSPITGQGSWEIVGGTSLGSPAWAAIIAIADQGRAVNGQSSLDGPTQTLPTLYALPASDFHSVAAFTHRGKLPAATATANTVTGRGTPNGALLVDGLASSEANAPLMTSSSVERLASKASRSKARRKSKAERKIVRPALDLAGVAKLPVVQIRVNSLDLSIRH
jgi:hypothetical protein